MLAWTRILSLASPDRAEEIPRLKELFEDDDVFDNLGFTLLHMMVTGLKGDSLESVLDNDISSLDKLDNNKKWPLMWAAARGDYEKVKNLLKYGASTVPVDRWADSAELGCLERFDGMRDLRSDVARTWCEPKHQRYSIRRIASALVVER